MCDIKYPNLLEVNGFPIINITESKSIQFDNGRLTFVTKSKSNLFIHQTGRYLKLLVDMFQGNEGISTLFLNVIFMETINTCKWDSDFINLLLNNPKMLNDFSVKLSIALGVYDIEAGNPIFDIEYTKSAKSVYLSLDKADSKLANNSSYRVCKLEIFRMRNFNIIMNVGTNYMENNTYTEHTLLLTNRIIGAIDYDNYLRFIDTIIENELFKTIVSEFIIIINNIEDDSDVLNIHELSKL